MINIQFYCRNCKKDSKGFAPVEVAVNIHGNRTIYSTPRKERPEDFSKAMSMKKDSDIKRYCEAVRSNVQTCITDMTKSGQGLSKLQLRNYIKYGGVRNYTLEDLFADWLEVQKLRVGKTTGERQYRKFELVRDLFFDTFDKDAPAGSVTQKDVEKFYYTILDKYAPASAHSIMVKVKKVFRVGFESGKIKATPFAGLETRKPKPREEWLTDGEMELIRKMNIHSEAIERARDLFLFQCNSGMSYSDMTKLTASDIIEENGVYSVSKRRAKTGIKYNSVLLPEGVEILKKYNFSLPHVSNPKYNLNLLKIETILGLDKHLHSHLGRKVYGTALLRGGCSMKAVSKALGHSTTQVTESTYAFLQDRDVIAEIAGKML